MNLPAVIDVEVLDYLPAKTLLKLIEQQQKVKKWSAAFQQTVKSRPDLFRRFEELDIDLDFCLRTGDINLNFTGDGDRLAEVWKELRRNGYAPNSRPKKGESSFYTHWLQDGLSTFWMNFSSSVCRRVKTGTKTVEVDVYETQCGEIPELESPTSALAVANGDDDVPF